MFKPLLVLIVLFSLAAGYVGYAMEPEQVPLRLPFEVMDTRAGRWTGRQAQPFTDEVLAVLGVDDHVNRIYQASPTAFASLYVGYYQSQREGDTIHSPMNCLPGAGWIPMATSMVAIDVPGRAEPIRVKRVLIEKGIDRQVAYYWYQSHGRVVANEYWSKVTMVYDAFRSNRSDAAMVRVVTPIHASTGGEAAADRNAIDFIQSIFPTLEAHLPS